MEIRAIRVPDEVGYYTSLHNAVNPDDPVTVEDAPGLGRVAARGRLLRRRGRRACGRRLGRAQRETYPRGADPRAGGAPRARDRLGALRGGLALGGGARARRTRGSCARAAPDGLAFAEHRGFVEIGREQRAGARPDRDRGAGRRAARRVSRSSPGRSGPTRPRASTPSTARRCRTSPARRTARSSRSTVWLATHMERPGRPPGGDVRRARRRRGRRLCEVPLHRGAADDGAPRPDRRPARVARPGDRPRAQGDADPVGHGARLRAARHAERAAQRADPPAERRVRVPAGPGPRAPARPAGGAAD